MRRTALIFLMAATAWPDTQLISLRTLPAEASLQGARATQQFVALAKYADGTERDVTAEVEWRLSRPALAKFISTGRLGPMAEGALTLTAALQGKQGRSEIRIAGAASARAATFTREISGILTKRGCNTSVCHGGVKGQGGFKLSANALYPADDYQWITQGGVYQVLSAEVKGTPVPRIDLKNPERSALIRKPTMATPHAGGKRFDLDSDDYRIMLDWIRHGAPFRDETGAPEPKLTRLELFPSTVVMTAAAEHRLLVTAHFSDGHKEDYTHESLYTVNDGEVASAVSGGVVRAKRRGETSILVRAAGQVASVVVGVVGPAVPNYPELKGANIIDDRVLEKFRQLRILPSAL